MFSLWLLWWHHVTNICPPPRVSQGDLSQLGRVVLQGGFSVWISHKRAAVRMKEMARFKPMQRHLFLYDHAVLFCKRRDEDNADRTPFYSFKSCLRVLDLTSC